MVINELRAMIGRVRRWQQLGITSVPSVIVNQRQLIQGGQTAEAYERTLRHIANEERRSA